MNNLVKTLVSILLVVVALVATLGVIVFCIWFHQWPSLNMIQGIINCWLGFVVFVFWADRS